MRPLPVENAHIINICYPYLAYRQETSFKNYFQYFYDLMPIFYTLTDKFIYFKLNPITLRDGRGGGAGGAHPQCFYFRALTSLFQLHSCELDLQKCIGPSNGWLLLLIELKI